VRVELDAGEIVRTQANKLRTWVAFVLGDYDQRRPSTIHNREPVRRPARANRSGIHDSSGLNRPLKRLLCRLWFRCVDAWARIGSDTIARPWPSRSS
jgi:hypothetical protein